MRSGRSWLAITLVNALCLVVICNAVESPQYTALHRESEFKIRLYRDSAWMSGPAKQISSKKATRDGFHRNAFGPSFGTVCLSGLLIWVVRVVRAIVDSARQEGASGMVNIVLQCCVNVFLAAFDFLNKFTINFAAITGEAYCASARMSYELLKRNLLSAIFVETISTRLLVGIAVVLSVIYAVVVCAIVNSISDLEADSYFVAAMAWVLLLVVLGYFVHVLDNVINTVYVCYAKLQNKRNPK